jgi:hypothetical protein
MSRRARVGVFLAAAAVSSIFFIDLCNLVYACGCRSLWAGADAACNIHTHGVKHCPLCSVGLAGSLAVWVGIVATQGAVVFRASSLQPVVRSILAFAAFPFVFGAIAVGLGLWLGYWTRVSP